MRTPQPRPSDVQAWIAAPSPDERKEPGYDEALAAAIAAGLADAEAGRVMSSEDFWAKWDADHPAR